MLRHPLAHEPIVLPTLAVAIISAVLAVWGINIEAPADPVAAPVAEALEAIVQVLIISAATGLTAFVAAKRANTTSEATFEAYNRKVAEDLAVAEAEAAGQS